MKKEGVIKQKEEYFRGIYDNLKKQTELELEFLLHQVEYYKELLELKELEEPMKIFQKNYSKWLIERDTIEEQLIHSLKELAKISKEKIKTCNFK